jgi:uncharacterized SAM-binding protein YcdF (DUF218 family)
MVFYFLGALSLTVSGALFFTDNRKPGQSYSFMAGVLCLCLGGLQDTSFLQIAWVRYFVIVSWFLLGMLSPFVFFFMGIAFVVNGLKLLKREGWSKRYTVLVLLGVAILTLVVLFLLNYFLFNDIVIWKFMRLLGYVIIYFTLAFVGFLFATIFYRVVRLRYDKDFVIVLGAELLPNGEISPLLRSRLDKTVQFYRRQVKRTAKIPCRLIVSGGEGADEPFSEAYAMKRYLIKKGIPAEVIIEEAQSLNTYQNLLYSKDIMDRLKRDYKCIFITNTFHVFRSSVYARRVGLKAKGLGARTDLYYLPYAFFREFIALLLIYGQLNALLLGVVFSFGIIRVYLQ